MARENLKRFSSRTLSNVSCRITGLASKVTTPARRLPSGCAMAARVPFGKGTCARRGGEADGLAPPALGAAAGRLPPPPWLMGGEEGGRA